MPGYICRSLFVEAGAYLVIAYLFKVNIEDYPPRTRDRLLQNLKDKKGRWKILARNLHGIGTLKDHSS